MANMTISELRPAGSDLFADSENFLQELTEQEIGELLGIRGGAVEAVQCINGNSISGIYCSIFCDPIKLYPYQNIQEMLWPKPKPGPTPDALPSTIQYQAKNMAANMAS